MKQNPKTTIVTTAKTDKDSSGGWLTNFFGSMKIMDGWSNIMTGLGLRDKDARTHQRVRWKRMDQYEIESLYSGEAMAAKVVDQPVEEAMQTGYEWAGISKEQAKTLSTRLKELFFDENIKKAGKWARMYGGSAILKAYDDELRLEKPATKGRMAIKSLVVFHRFELITQWDYVQKDMLSPDFGRPVWYTFMGRGASAAYSSNIKIFFRRLVRFDGALLPEQLLQSNNYWHDTVLSRSYDAIRGYAYAHDSVNAALKDLSVAVFKVKGLADMISANDDAGVLRRMEIVNMTKSMVRAIVVDAEGEDFEYKVRNLTGAADLVSKSEDRLSADTSIPRSILLGESPKGGGLGEKGDHSLENWYKFVECYRDTMLKPQMLEIAKEVCDELGIAHEELDIEFNPLWELSEKEIVEMRYKQAQTDQINIQEGVVDPQEARDSRFAGDKYSIETKIDGKLKPIPLTEPDPKEKV